MSTSSGYLPVDGTSLYYELRGAGGPLLLLISAGMGSAKAHDWTSTLLAQRFRVLTYDRRGFARSRGEEPLHDYIHSSDIVPRNARDAAALIRHFSLSAKEPAFVFGSCFGGIIALELLHTNPELVKLAVVHEPTIPLLVSESQRQHVLSTMGSLPNLPGEAAAAALTSLILKDADRNVLQQSDEYDRLIAYSSRHMSHFYAHEAKYAPAYMVDWNLLHAQKDKLVLAVGTESRLPIQTDPVRSISVQIGCRVVEMPGGHFPFRVDRERTVRQLVSLFGQPALQYAEKALL